MQTRSYLDQTISLITSVSALVCLDGPWAPSIIFATTTQYFMTAEAAVPTTTSFRFPGDLAEREYFWRDHYNFIHASGYQLRARYKPDWIPSWFATKELFIRCEDGQIPGVRPLAVLFQRRRSTTNPVALALLPHRRHSNVRWQDRRFEEGLHGRSSV